MASKIKEYVYENISPKTLDPPNLFLSAFIKSLSELIVNEQNIHNLREPGVFVWYRLKDF